LSAIRSDIWIISVSSDIGLFNLLQAIEFNDLERVSKLSKSSPKAINGDIKKLHGLEFFYPLIAYVRYDNAKALQILLESGNATKIDAKDCVTATWHYT
jgi:hypothetical protein